MAWYKTGTVSVTINTTSVTGTGTKFATNARVGDGFRGPDGQWYEIVNITSETVIAIYPSYKGATVSGSANYTIAPLQGYNKETADRLRAITDSFGDYTGIVIDGGTISMSGNAYPTAPTSSTIWRVSAAGTAGGISYAIGDNLVYSKTSSTFYKVDNTFTKADVGLGNADNTSDAAKPISTATQTALNAKEPTITVLPITKGGTGGSTQATARDGLGLGTSATAILTTTRRDSTIGRVLKVGDHGIGAESLEAIPGTEIDNIRTNGFYYVSSGASQGSAPESTNGYLESKSVIPTYAIQKYTAVTSGQEYERVLSNGTWLPWCKTYNSGNMVGTVSQSGGVPTGAIIERGNNSNGEYIRLADGTQICLKSLSDLGALSAGGTATSVWSFPMPFSTSVGLVIDFPIVDGPATTYCTSFNSASATATYYAITAKSNSRILYRAQGRWY